MSDLVNIYVFLRENCPNADICMNLPPSYIKTLCGNENKIIFICKTVNRYTQLSPVIMSSDAVSGLDLTGSPLKDSFKLDALDISLSSNIVADFPWSEAEECYAGLQLEQARDILQKTINEKFEKSVKDSIWVLCNGENSEKIILLESIFEPAFNSRGFVKSLGFMPEDEISMDQMLASHYKLIKNSQKLETTIELFFKIHSNITLKLGWQTSAPTPSLAINKNADITLYQNIRMDDTKTVAEHFWRQLFMLELLKNEIVKFREQNDMSETPTYNEDRSGLDLELVKQKILEILSELKDVKTQEFESPYIEAVVDKVIKRTSSEVTDQLWDILKYTSNYNDLKSALTFTFKTVANCNVVNMPSNSNRLAELILDIAKQRLAIPKLTGTEPLELLLEIGLEKIIKDYEIIFFESKICTLDVANDDRAENVPVNSRKSLFNAGAVPTEKERKTLMNAQPGINASSNEDIEFKNSRFNEREITNKLSKLSQIHMLLEHLLLIQNNLNLDSGYTAIAEQYLKKPVISIDKLRSMQHDKLEITIPNNKIFDLLEKSTIHARRIAMKTENKFKSVENIFYHSLEPIFPPIIIDNVPAQDIETRNYWCLQYTKLGTRKINHN